MKRFLIPVAGVAGALVLAVAIFAAGGLMATNALASGAFFDRGGDHGDWSAQLPPELKGLGTIPAAQRFEHFKGVTVNLTDQNNQPLTVTVTPGTVTSAGGTSLTLAANDGSTKTYAVDANTIEKKAPAANDKVVVVALNGSGTATAVMAVPPAGFGPHGR
jgi:hypothetical protein